MSRRILVIIGLLAACAAAQVGGPYLPGRTYHGQNGYIEYVVGTAPIIISSPHGGDLSPPSIPDRTWGALSQDGRRSSRASLPMRSPRRPVVVRTSC